MRQLAAHAHQRLQHGAAGALALAVLLKVHLIIAHEGHKVLTLGLRAPTGQPHPQHQAPVLCEVALRWRHMGQDSGL